MASAAPGTKAKKVRLTGMVLAACDDDGRVLAAKLATAGEWADIDVVLDEKGTQLAEQMADRDVVVTGSLADHDGWQTLKVRKFRELRPRER